MDNQQVNDPFNIGSVYGQLTIISEVRRYGKKRYKKYLCKCKCGNEKEIYHSSLKSGKTTSCGCFGAKQRLSANTKHGMSHTRFYSIWEGVKRRATSERQKEKQHTYLECTIEESWNDFQCFMDDMLDSYNDYVNRFGKEPELDKDIVGKSKHYSKENCIWVGSHVNRAESTYRNNGYDYLYCKDTATIIRLD